MFEVNDGLKSLLDLFNFENDFECIDSEFGKL